MVKILLYPDRLQKTALSTVYSSTKIGPFYLFQGLFERCGGLIPADVIVNYRHLLYNNLKKAGLQGCVYSIFLPFP
jgi:hypothetical protein